MNKEIIKALLFFTDNKIQKYSYLKDYINEDDLYCMLLDLKTLIDKAKLSKKDMLVVNCIKYGRTHEEIAIMLGITRSAVSHKLSSIVDKLHNVS